MTIEEKRFFIDDYCLGLDTCDDCPLYGLSGDCIDDNRRTIIDRNYNIIFGDKKTSDKTSDKIEAVNSPAHYNDGKIEVIDYIEDKKLGFCLGNVIKYVSRAGKKDPEKEIEDLNKAKWYLERRIKELAEG